MDRQSTKWTVTAIRISSKSSADVLFGEKAVRIRSEQPLLAHRRRDVYLLEQDGSRK